MHRIFMKQEVENEQIRRKQTGSLFCKCAQIPRRQVEILEEELIQY